MEYKLETLDYLHYKGTENKGLRTENSVTGLNIRN